MHRTAGKQSWDPAHYARNVRFVSDLGMAVVKLLKPGPQERILDLGCGDGVLTKKLAEAGSRVFGCDGSAAQVGAARKLGLDVCVMDGEDLGFAARFDAVFSNAALHWMLRPDAVIDGVWQALKPGGRFVAECGAKGCIASIQNALVEVLEHRGIDGKAINPWYFPTVEDYAARLERRGFKVYFIATIPRPTPLPGDIIDWLNTLAQSYVYAVPENERVGFLQEVRQLLLPILCDASGRWTADYVRLRFAARKSAESNQ